MKAKQSVLVMLVTYAAIFMSSCQELRELAPGTQEGSSEQPSESAVLEHTAEFKTTKLHGTRYLLKDASCFTCHNGDAVEVPETPEDALAAIQKDREKDKRGRKKACASCHENFPHGKQFKKKHGKVFLGNQANCMGCHGEKLQGRGKAMGCASCHDKFPHDTQFQSKHGQFFLENSKACFQCHNEKNQGSIVSCSSCHENFPHPKQFKKEHGALYFDDPESCMTCHAPKPDRPSAVACASCHVATHKPEFKATREHGKKFIEERKEAGSGGKISCWKCHTDKKPAESEAEPAEEGRGSKRSCAICHETYPHPKNFDDSKKHGKAFRDNPSECAVCHGREFAGAGESVSCKDCHEFPHTGSWGMGNKHGPAFMKERQGEGAMVSCADCHTKDNGAKVACDTCHFWHLPAGIPSKDHVSVSQNFRNGCTNCHTNGKRLLPWDRGCYECHLETTEPKVPKDWETLKPTGRSPQSIVFPPKKPKATRK